jgi:hypothetical protein
VVADAGEILDAAAADHDDRVLLEIVTLARDVAHHLVRLVSRTLATLRIAEFGFLGVVV